MTEEIKLIDNFRINTNVSIYTFPANLVPDYESFQKLKNKEQYKTDFDSNIITSSGFSQICFILAGGTSTLNYCAVGTGSPSSTALGTEVGTRMAISYKYIINNEFHMDTFYGKNDPNSSSNALTEAGLFNQLASGGTMFASKTISITKSTSITMVIAWTWSFS